MFINAGVFARTVKNYEGETRITLNQINGHYWRGAFDQAWVQFGGLRVGLQPSLFSFSRTGYTFMPGYASYMTTPAVSYTHRIENINVLPGLLPRLGASISVSAEDPTLRRYPDGVLSRYPTGMGYPDFVAHCALAHPPSSSTRRELCTKSGMSPPTPTIPSCRNTPHGAGLRSLPANIVGSGAGSLVPLAAKCTARPCYRRPRLKARCRTSAYRICRSTM
ncbi:MAG: hypothetical protein WA156_13865 [Methylocystis silviterrae]